MSTGDALAQLLRDLEAERARVVPAPQPRIHVINGEVVQWPPAGVEARTYAEQAEARRIAYVESLAFDQAHRGQLHDRRHLRAVAS